MAKRPPPSDNDDNQDRGDDQSGSKDDSGSTRNNDSKTPRRLNRRRKRRNGENKSLPLEFKKTEGMENYLFPQWAIHVDNLSDQTGSKAKRRRRSGRGAPLEPSCEGSKLPRQSSSGPQRSSRERSAACRRESSARQTRPVRRPWAAPPTQKVNAEKTSASPVPPNFLRLSKNRDRGRADDNEDVPSSAPQPSSHPSSQEYDLRSVDPSTLRSSEASHQGWWLAPSPLGGSNSVPAPSPSLSRSYGDQQHLTRMAPEHSSSQIAPGPPSSSFLDAPNVGSGSDSYSLSSTSNTASSYTTQSVVSGGQPMMGFSFPEPTLPYESPPSAHSPPYLNPVPQYHSYTSSAQGLEQYPPTSSLQTNNIQNPTPVTDIGQHSWSTTISRPPSGTYVSGEETVQPLTTMDMPVRSGTVYGNGIEDRLQPYSNDLGSWSISPSLSPEIFFHVDQTHLMAPASSQQMVPNSGSAFQSQTDGSYSSTYLNGTSSSYSGSTGASSSSGVYYSSASSSRRQSSSSSSYHPGSHPGSSPPDSYYPTFDTSPLYHSSAAHGGTLLSPYEYSSFDAHWQALPSAVHPIPAPFDEEGIVSIQSNVPFIGTFEQQDGTTSDVNAQVTMGDSSHVYNWVEDWSSKPPYQ